MSFQDTLMNVVYLDPEPDVDDVFVMRCAWCVWFSDEFSTLDDANNAKIDHENEHGIYSDPDTGELYYDPSENQHAHKEN